MNRIILAYSAANSDLAQRIDLQLSRIGIPFDHMPSAPGDWSKQVFGTGEPVLLLVTDNLLTDRNCMTGLLDAMQNFPPHLPMLAVVAEGVDEAGNQVSTSIDRMVNMLHYMNHWQNAWMQVSTDYQNAAGEEKLTLETELDALRMLANQTGDVITLLRERAAVTRQAFEANDFALFFEKFDLSDWHGQYRKIAHATPETIETAPPVTLPEATLAGGILSPEPVDLPDEITTVPETPHEAPTVTEETQIVEPEPEIPQPTPKVEPLGVVEQTIQDAKFWLERGHVERSLELLRTAVEAYPDHTLLQQTYQDLLHTQNQDAPAPTPTPTTAAPQQPASDAHPYELMGNAAVEKGDFLFAKYCWDRVAEIDPAYPGIYRKLGLMTAEHLHDYRETALVYLKKAQEITPDDAEVNKALKELLEEERPLVVMEPPQAPHQPAEDVVQEAPVNTQPQQPLVMITGATSGIGRATAEVFARNGYRLILTGRRVDRLVEVKNKLETDYRSDVLLLPFDVRNAGAVQSAFDSLPENYREIDVLINNAGLAKGLSPIHEGSLEHWETMIDTNIKGLLYVTRLVTPGMVERRRGHIVNVGSSAGKEVYPNGNVYCATKFAVDALSRSFRYDLHKFNIRVSQVSPGHVEETEFALNRFDGDAERARIYNDFQPLRAPDVAEAIWFMVSRPAHVNIQDVFMFGTQQAASMLIDRSGR
ncbi:MAG: SDR family NAD(P)-dependent oxidoreductase [Saprospiraceae bacterium]|nr:SDR family NAD(P)-dependent oxidoreductase [Saprospiraceae bacterium]